MAGQSMTEEVPCSADDSPIKIHACQTSVALPPVRWVTHNTLILPMIASMDNGLKAYVGNVSNFHIFLLHLVYFLSFLYKGKSKLTRAFSWNC
jgi:hypothetical protein